MHGFLSNNRYLILIQTNSFSQSQLVQTVSDRHVGLDLRGRGARQNIKMLNKGWRGGLLHSLTKIWTT